MREVLILSNALDDTTRIGRGITTDSPAASRKVFMAAAAIRRAGVAATVVSLGRGRRSGHRVGFAARARRHAGVPVVYLRFDNRRIWSELVTLAAGAAMMFRLARRRRDTVLVVYNRFAAYVPAMVVARLAGMRIVLDLEDGSIATGRSFRALVTRTSDALFDGLCSRALLACSALAAGTGLRPVLPYYGVAPPPSGATRLMQARVTVLLGGTVDRDTGGEIVVDAVEALRRDSVPWAAALAIEVTGKGGSIERLARLAEQPGHPAVKVWGRTSDADYAAIVARADVGLALKLNAGHLAQTTFPSKVIEMAAAGQLVLTTDISDVRAVLGDGARYVSTDTSTALIDQLAWIVANRDAARAVAARGSAAAARIGDAVEAGARLVAFLFPGPE